MYWFNPLSCQTCGAISIHFQKKGCHCVFCKCNRFVLKVDEECAGCAQEGDNDYINFATQIHIPLQK